MESYPCKPVSQVRILPGAPTFVQLRGHFKLLRAPWAPDVNYPAGRGHLADVAALGPGWGCIIVRIERQPGAGWGSAIGIEIVVRVADVLTDIPARSGPIAGLDPREAGIRHEYAGNE